jgi:microcystin-dependent protein
MDRAFLSGSSGTPPVAPVSPSIGYPRPGDPGSGTPATKPGPWWYHMVTEELRAVVEIAGLTPTQATLTQVRDSINLMIRRQAACVGVATRGGSDVYTSDLAIDLTALADGVRLSLRASAANTTTAPTLAVDATAAKVIVRNNNQALQVGDIAGASHWLQLVYDAGNDRWVLLNPALGIDLTPAGVVIAHAANAAPAGYLKANGAAVSRTVYAALFTAIGTTFGVGDGSTTFNVPNLRGEFLRGWDDGRGIDTGRVFGSAQLDAMQGHYHTVRAGANTGNGIVAGTATEGTTLVNDTVPAGGRVQSPASDGVNGTPRTAAETRGRNIALLYCIKF